MIKEVYCSKEVSILLKENGFNEFVHHEYHDTLSTPHFHKKSHNFNGYEYAKCGTEWFSAPTHQMAMRWLREVYHIEIYITFGFPFIDGKQQYKYFWSIFKVCDNHLEYLMYDHNEKMADSYEEAIEAALKYALTNLI